MDGGQSDMTTELRPQPQQQPAPNGGAGGDCSLYMSGLRTSRESQTHPAQSEKCPSSIQPPMPTACIRHPTPRSPCGALPLPWPTPWPSEL